MKLTRYFLCAVLLVLVSFGTAWAQEDSVITGSVTDPSGAVVPHASVTAIQEETGDKQVTTTNNAGLYSFPGLLIGHYTLIVTAPGFTTYKKTGIVMNVAQTLREDAQLAVGANSQTVTVQANALQVQSETNEVSSLITGKQMTQIETNGRNITSLTTLGTGVSGNLPSFNGVTAQGSTATISFNGMRPDQNNWLIDGGEVYDRGSGGKVDVMPSPDVIAQFQVLSSNYSPDYGISSGATINMELKSGTNKFHGGVWEFNRNDDLDADSYFAKQTHTPTPELRLNIYGGDIGGPLWIPHIYNQHKDKTFFFWSEEWRKYISGVNPSPTETIPTSDFPTAGASLAYSPFNGGVAPIVPSLPGNAAYTAKELADGLTPGSPFPGNVIPANLLDPNAVLFMNTGAIPKPNDGTDNYIASPRQPTSVREDVVRIDHNVSDKYHLMGSWIHDQMSQTIIPTMWSGDSYDTVGSVFANPSWGAVIKLTQTISPTVLNETALDVNGNTISITPTGIYSQPSGWSATSFFPGNNAENRLPQVGFSNGEINTTYTENYFPWHNAYLDYQPRDDLSWTKGKHSLKFGVAFMREDKNQQQQADTQGNYGFSGSAFSQDPYVNFLLGLSSSYQQLEAMHTDHWLNNTYSFYGNDNWHITQRLTLNLGVRYDALPHVYEKNNQVSNFVPADYTAANAQSPSASTGDLNPAGPGFSTVNGAAFYLDGIQQAGVNGFPRGLVKNDYFTIQPRLGFAYDMMGDGKTVLRGGLGIFYNRVQGNDIYDLDTNPPFSYNPSVSNVYFSNPSTSATTGSTASIPTGPAGLENINYYYPIPATAQYSLGLQRELAPSVVAALQYVGSASWNQDDLREINDLPLSNLADRQLVAKGANANLYRPYQGYANILQEETATNSNYNSLQAALRMDNRHGLTLQLAYTWSHEIDIQSADLTTETLAGSGGAISNPYDYNYDKGSGAFDRRNIFNANYIYDLPFFRHSGNVFAREALGGWQLAGVTIAESGSPQNIYYNGADTLGLGGNTTNRPNIVAPVKFPKTQLAWFTTSSFADPVAPWNGGANNGFGDARKDTITQPGLFNWNIALYKVFAFTSNPDGAQLQFRAETFNTFNHTEFQNIDTGTNDSTYGQVTSTYDPRVIQLGAKLLF